MEAPRTLLKVARIDPASVQAAAGCGSSATVRHQNHHSNRHGPCKAPTRFTGEFQRKMQAKCSPTRMTDPIAFRYTEGCAPGGHRPTSPRAARRPGDKEGAWACHTGGGAAPTKQELCAMKGEMKVHSFPYVKQAFCITGCEDLGPAATNRYVKSDRPPSADYARSNHRRHVLPAQRGDRQEGNPQLEESPDMDVCLRPGGPLGSAITPRFRLIQSFGGSPDAGRSVASSEAGSVTSSACSPQGRALTRAASAAPATTAAARAGPPPPIARSSSQLQQSQLPAEAGAARLSAASQPALGPAGEGSPAPGS